MKSISYRLRVKCDAEEESFELLLVGEDKKKYQHVSGPDSTPAAKRLSKMLYVALAAAWPSASIDFNPEGDRIKSVS